MRNRGFGMMALGALLLAACDMTGPTEPTVVPDSRKPVPICISGQAGVADAPLRFRLDSLTDSVGPINNHIRIQGIRTYTHVRDTAGAAFFAVRDSGIRATRIESVGPMLDSAGYLRLDTIRVDSLRFTDFAGMAAGIDRLSAAAPLLAQGCLEDTVGRIDSGTLSTLTDGVSYRLSVSGDTVFAAKAFTTYKAQADKRAAYGTGDGLRYWHIEGSWKSGPSGWAAMGLTLTRETR